MKESHDIELYGSMFKWKYPLWYAKNILAEDCIWFGMCYIENLVMNPSGGSIQADYIEELIVEKDKVDPDKTVITCIIS